MEKNTLIDGVSVPVPSDERFAHFRRALLKEAAASSSHARSPRNPGMRWRAGLVATIVAVVGLPAVMAVASDRPLRLSYWLDAPDPGKRARAGLQSQTVGVWSDERRMTYGYPDVTRAGEPTSSVISVLRGTTEGNSWEIGTFADTDGGVCLAFTAGQPERFHGTSILAPGVVNCDWSVAGVGSSSGDAPLVKYMLTIPGRVGTGSKYLFGVAAPSATQVVLLSEDSPEVIVRTLDGPPDADSHARYWVAVLPLGHLVHEIVVRGADGQELGREALPEAL